MTLCFCKILQTITSLSLIDSSSFDIFFLQKFSTQSARSHITQNISFRQRRHNRAGHRPAGQRKLREKACPWMPSIAYSWQSGTEKKK
jgi:hypothetical protein